MIGLLQAVLDRFVQRHCCTVSRLATQTGNGSHDVASRTNTGGLCAAQHSTISCTKRVIPAYQAHASTAYARPSRPTSCTSVQARVNPSTRDLVYTKICIRVKHYHCCLPVKTALLGVMTRLCVFRNRLPNREALFSPGWAYLCEKGQTTSSTAYSYAETSRAL